MIKNKYIILIYTITGSLFGCLFPIIAYIYEINLRNLNYSLESIAFLHRSIDLMYMIDTAPIFLGLLSMIAGINYSKTILINNQLTESTKDLLKSKNELTKMSNSLKEKNLILNKNFYYDSLTSLPNDKFLIKNFVKDENNVLLITINISHFREINTLFGYDIGDEVLKQVALRILESDFDCYKGHADEFIIVSYNMADSLELDILANYICSFLSDKSYLVKDLEIYVTVNLGFSTFSNEDSEEKNISNLIHNSNFALKYAKEKNLQYSFYNNDLIKNLKSNYNYIWKERIITAIKDSNIITFFQPIINNNNGYIEKYEALIRLKENNKIINPYHFILSSKKYGLYNNLTRLVVMYVMDVIEKKDKEISINISIDDIRNITTMRLIYERIQTLGELKAKNIVFELLESEGIENYTEVKHFINNIKQYGCKVAIDDFGSGYSNFSHILNLNVDYIKIDASIIKNIDKDQNCEYIAKLIVDFSNKVGIKTIAEFVHSRSVFEKVKEIGITYSQGYYFSEPLENID